MFFGVNVGLDTRCVHRKFQVCRLGPKYKKSYIRKIVRKEKSLKPGNDRVTRLTGLFCVASQNSPVAR